MLPRAVTAWWGSTSSEMIEPPGPKPGRHGDGRVAGERPDLEHLGGLGGEDQHLEEAALLAAHHHPPQLGEALPGRGVDRLPGTPAGAVVCASAYSSTSGSIIGAMATMVGALPRTGATAPGPLAAPRPPLPPDLRAQPEQPAHVVDVGVEERAR